MNATQNAAAPAAHIHFFANLEQNPPLMIPLKDTADQNEIKAQAMSVHHQLKGQNARIGFDRVMALLSGQEAMFKGYEVVDLATHNKHAAQKLGGTVEAKLAPAPAPQPPQPSKNVGARGTGRNFEPLSNPSKKVVPLKRGALYTRLMEFMMRPEGATHKFMVEHSGNKTPGGVNDVLGWQIKQKGYGLKYNQANGTYHLVLPQGQKELIYA